MPAGRALAGEDGIEALTTRAQLYADRVVWVRETGPEVVALLKKYVKSD